MSGSNSWSFLQLGNLLETAGFRLTSMYCSSENLCLDGPECARYCVMTHVSKSLSEQAGTYLDQD
jgi:hypothetical protein